MIVPLSFVHALGHAAYRLLGARTRALQVGRRRLALYELRGAGSGPPALLVHGLGANANSFISLVRAARRLCTRVIVPDLPGHGRSAFRPGDPPLQLQELADAIDALLADLGEPALIVGNSLGGALGLHALAERPEQVLGFLGLAPAGAPLTSEERASLREHFSGGLDNARELQRRLWHRTPAAAWLVLRDFGRYWRVPAVEQIVAEVFTAPAILAHARLRERRGRAQILWGESDKLLPSSSVAFFREHLGEDAVEVVPRCGHLPQLERPRLVAARLEALIKKLAAAK